MSDGKKTGIGEGIRTGIGILTAVKDAIAETVQEAVDRGDLAPDKATAVVKDAAQRLQSSIEEARERLDTVPRKEFDLLRAEVAELAFVWTSWMEVQERPGFSRKIRVHRSPSTDEMPARLVTETFSSGIVPLWHQPEWVDRFPWLVQGTTGRGAEDESFDLGVYGQVPAGRLMERWTTLRKEAGMRTVVHSRQVHASEVALWDRGLPEGIVHVSGYDGHVSSVPGLLLAVSVADCVPVFILSEQPRLIAMVHSGWRGVAGGIAERAIGMLVQAGAAVEKLLLHCGPAICGKCYEVGPEVHAAVRPHQTPPDANTLIDLRAAISERVEKVGLRAENLSISTHCTLCGSRDFFSHRGGSAGRQMGVLGLRI